MIIIGDACCGKTTLLHRIVDGKQPESEKYDLTIGVDTRSKTFPFTIEEKGKAPKDVKIKLQFWDTAGQERFRTLITSYYRGTHCCILVFDITNPDSFFHLYKWIDSYTHYNEFPMKNILIVGNKHDLERAVTKNEIDLWCRDFEMEFIETSVFADSGIDHLIKRAIERCLD